MVSPTLFFFLGALPYQKSLYVFFSFLSHWEKNELPPARVLQFMPPFLSEETGEIALSVLTSRLPASARSDHKQTRKIWQTLKKSGSADGHNEMKSKKRRIGKDLLLIYLTL